MPPGRRVNDPEKTRKAIRQAALKAFSDRGFAGASMADIAGLAGVPKSLVQYHYVTKEGLWNAAMEEAAKPLLSLAKAYAAEGGRPDIGTLLTTRFSLLERNPRLRRMLLWMSLEGRPLPQNAAELLPGVLKNLAQTLRAEPKRTRYTVLALVCAMDGWFLLRQSLGPVLDPEAHPAERDAALLSHLLQVATDEVTILREGKN